MHAGLSLTRTQLAVAPSPRAASRSRLTGAEWRALLAIGVLAAVGFALRLAAAQGDLWIDEIWSLRLVERLTSPDQVFWRLAEDNNHHLNSLWLYLVGQSAAAWLDRLPAVLLGTATVVAAGRLGWRTSPAAGVVAALVAALSYPLVNYGSEARGYAGLILACVVALDAFERAMASLEAPGADREAVRRGSWTMAAAIGLGTLSHLTTAALVPVLGLTAAIRLSRAGRTPRQALDGAYGLLRPSLLALVPAAAAVASGILVQGSVTFGGITPFAPERFAAGFGGLLAALTGWPAGAPLLVVAVVLGGLALAWARGLIPPGSAGLLAVALGVLPGAMFAARLANTEFPRYFLVSGVVLLAVAAEILGRCWDRGGWARAACAVLVAAFCIGQFRPLASLLRDGRGGYGAAVTTMLAQGGATYAANYGPRTSPVVDAVAARLGADLRLVPASAFCTQRPDWYLYDSETARDVPPEVTAGPAGCTLTFERRAVFPTSALSGRQWVLLRRKG